MIRDAAAADSAAIVTIYNHYIRNTLITFEEDEISAIEMASRMAKVIQLGLPWLVATDEAGELQGYAYASPWKSRSAYRFSVEASVYISPQAQSQGLGSQLYSQLFDKLRACEVHSILAVVALPNPASIALSEKFGMQKVAHYPQVGRKFNQWVDVGCWQLLFDSQLD